MSLLKAAGDLVYARGEDYVRYVRGLRTTDFKAYASIQAKNVYQVELDWSGPLPDGSCTCRHRADGNFCKHLVATGLAAIDTGRVAVDDTGGSSAEAALEAAVQAMDVDELRELVMTLAQRDGGVRRLLEIRATTTVGDAAHAKVELEAYVRDTLAFRRPTDNGLPVGGRTLRFGSSGVDEVDFLLAANTGSEPRPLHKGASGGELSRVMLALEVALAGTSPVPTFVFDEVDSGVGGKAAVEVGRRLAKLAESAQVLVVTHLPQVAAYADRHVVVEKASDGSVTTSGLTLLDAAGRERELSRMFAGMEESETALAHARELLEAAGRATA